MPKQDEQDCWNAFVERAANPSQAAQHAGPLSGVRLAVKDNIAVVGMKWTCGLPLLAGRRAETDASCVTRLKTAGAIIAGVAATDSAGFGMTTPGVVNPLDPTLTVGGSSGGSAAAVAAGLADLALGTDTAGSVRVPAACCGLFGFKPTFGKVATDQITPLATTFDHVGLIAADLGLLERASSVLLGEPIQKPRERPLVIGFEPHHLSHLDETIAEAVMAAVICLGAKGHSIREIRLPARDDLVEAHGIITCREAFEVWKPHWPHDVDALGDTVRRTLAYAQDIADADVADARRAHTLLRQQITAAFAGVDLILGATIAIPPPRAGARRATMAGEEVPIVRALMADTVVFNVSGHPALAIPMRNGSRPIPVSLQIAGTDDMTLLADAKAILAALG